MRNGFTALLASLLVMLALIISPQATAAALTMRAVIMTAYGGAEVLVPSRVPRPVAGNGEVLVRVKAASVNPYDWKFREGKLSAFRKPAFPVIPGIDFAGVIATVGPGVTRWKPGDPVLGFISVNADHGAYAEFVPVPEGNLVRKPASLGWADAAALPVVALTAWKVIIDNAALKPGQTVLIQGGSGSVGSVAVQLARQRGARVFATASAEHLDFLRSLGVERAIDYRAQRFEDLVHDVDLGVDMVSTENAARTMSTVRAGGRMIALNRFAPDAVADCAARQISCVYIPTFYTDLSSLEQIVALAAQHKLTLRIAQSLPLASAAQAQQLSQSGAAAGKLILIP